MITFIATVHILACLALIGLVLLQDSKGGGVFSTQSNSSSVLGASGADNLATTLTKIVSAVLIITCLALAALSARSQKSVIDSGVTQQLPNQPQTTANAGSASSPTSAATSEPAAASASAPTK